MKKYLIYIVSALLLIALYMCATIPKMSAKIDSLETKDSIIKDNVELKSDSVEFVSVENVGSSMTPIPMESVSYQPVERMNRNVESSNAVKDVIKNDSVSNGDVALHCPNEMKINQVYDVFGIFSKGLSVDSIESLIKGKVEEHSKNPEEILQTTSTLHRSINFYDYIELRLIDPSKTFSIEKIHEKDKQKIVNGKVGENWHWKVVANKVNPDAQLLLKVIVYDESGDNISDSFSKTYSVKIDTSGKFYFSELLNYLYKNPTWLLTTLIIPLFVYFWKKFKEKKKE